MLNETSISLLTDFEFALLVSAAFKKPCGVDHISAVRSSTAAGCRVGVNADSFALAGGGLRFQAVEPLIY